MRCTVAKIKWRCGGVRKSWIKNCVVVLNMFYQRGIDPEFSLNPQGYEIAQKC
jgi:hypothetical protein